MGGVKGTKYLLKIRHHAPRPTENQKQCPSAFLQKGGGQKSTTVPQYFFLHIWNRVLSEGRGEVGGAMQLWERYGCPCIIISQVYGVIKIK